MGKRKNKKTILETLPIHNNNEGRDESVEKINVDLLQNLSNMSMDQKLTELYKINFLALQNIEVMAKKLLELDDIKSEVTKLKLELSTVQVELKRKDNHLCQLQKQISKMQYNNSERNLVAFGVKEVISTVDEVEKVFKKNLKTDIINLTEITRMGRRCTESSKPRPLLLRFNNKQSKDNVYVLRHLFKGSHIYLSHDFTDDVLFQRKELKTFAQKLNNNERYNLVGNKLIYCDKVYKYNMELDEIQKQSKSGPIHY